MQQLGQDYIKLAVKEMPTIPLMSYNVFTMMDETYWTGYPTADNPYTNPVSNWANTKYMFRQAEAGQGQIVARHRSEAAADPASLT